MNNIVLTACALVLAGTVSQVRAEEATVRGFIGNKTTSESYKIGNAAPGSGFKVMTRPTTNWNLEFEFKESEESERRVEKGKKAGDEGESISYKITTTVTNTNDEKQTKKWEWDGKQTPNTSSFNIAYCLTESETPDTCLAAIVNRSTTLHISSNKKDKEFPYTITGGMKKEDCGGSCSY